MEAGGEMQAKDLYLMDLDPLTWRFHWDSLREGGEGSQEYREWFGRLLVVEEERGADDIDIGGGKAIEGEDRRRAFQLIRGGRGREDA